MPTIFDSHRELEPFAPEDPGENTSGRTAARLLAAAITALLVSFLVVTRSNRALESTVTATPGTITAGSVRISDDDGGSALFRIPAMAPGRPYANCISVTYDGSILPARVELRGEGGGTLAKYLDFTVEVGTGGSFGDCGGFRSQETLFSGTLAEMLTTHSRTGSPIRGYTAERTGETRTFRLTVELADVDAASEGEAGMEFLWSARP